MEGSLRALKILVAVMGVMLVAGVVALAIGIAYKLGHRQPETVESAAVKAAPPVTPRGRPIAIPLPAGAHIIAAQSDRDRLMVRIGLPDGGEEFALFDWKTGARIGSLEFRPAPAAAR